MTQLTSHFTLEELVGSTARPASAAECAALPVLVRANLVKLAALLEKVRGVIGVPLQVTSGYRPPAENLEAGGVKNSQHLLGAAADILPVGITSAEAYSRALAPAVGRGALGAFGQLIVYPVQLPNGKGWSHLHISTLDGASSSNQVLVAIPNAAQTDTVFVSPAAANLSGAPAPSTETSLDFSQVNAGSSTVSTADAPEAGSSALSTLLWVVGFILAALLGVWFYGSR